MIHCWGLRLRVGPLWLRHFPRERGKAWGGIGMMGVDLVGRATTRDRPYGWAPLSYGHFPRERGKPRSFAKVLFIHASAAR